MSDSYATPVFATLHHRIKQKEAVVGVIGLGYVGLPLVLAALKNGFHVVGIDVDEAKVQSLNNKESYIHHIPKKSIGEAINSGRFYATSDFSKLQTVDIVLICVPTPLNKYREPDMTYVVATTTAIQPHLKSGHLIILESTTYPGTTHEILRPILQKNQLSSGMDFYLAYSPEREDPGNLTFQTTSIPKVVGGDGEQASALANLFYQGLTIQTVPVSSTQTAEAVKLTENIFRCVNIALVNELKIVFDKMGIDVWEVINAAKTKPFGFMPFYPGPGLGGHCIPIDPFYLTWKAREYGISTRFIELAGEINTAMPLYVVQKITEGLDACQRKGLNGSKILIVGLAYKKNVDDIRESPSFVIMELLKKRGAMLAYYDPYVPEILPMREHQEFVGRQSIALKADVIATFDAVAIVTDHDDVDYTYLTQHAKLVIDTRNATHGIEDDVLLKKIIKA